MPLQKEDVVKYLSKADHFQPGFCIAVRPGQKQVILAVRGTKSLSDALTDMAGRRKKPSAGCPSVWWVWCCTLCDFQLTPLSQKESSYQHSTVFVPFSPHQAP